MPPAHTAWVDLHARIDDLQREHTGSHIEGDIHQTAPFVEIFYSPLEGQETRATLHRELELSPAAQAIDANPAYRSVLDGIVGSLPRTEDAPLQIRTKIVRNVHVYRGQGPDGVLMPHRDGFEYLATFCLGSQNMGGGNMQIWDLPPATLVEFHDDSMTTHFTSLEKPVAAVLNLPSTLGHGYVIDESRWDKAHTCAPFAPMDNNSPAYRDLLIIRASSLHAPSSFFD